MTIKNTFYSTFLLLSSFALQAQESEKSGLNLKISSIELSKFGYFGGDHNIGFADMHKLINTKQNTIPNLSSFNSSSSGLANKYKGFNLAATFDLKKGNKAAFWGNPSLRTGFSFHESQFNLMQYYKDELFNSDTLFYTEQGSTNFIAIDSLSSTKHDFMMQSNRFRVHASLLFRTNQSNRLSFYSGIGLAFGVSLNSSLNHYITTTGGYRNRDHNDFNSQWLLDQIGKDKNTSSFQAYRAKSISDLIISLPIGIDFRIGQHNPIMKQVYLFGEVSPVISCTKYAGISGIWNIGYSGAYGIRIKF
jgi:hypothetical protein